jgi:hypothetical protein
VECEVYECVSGRCTARWIKCGSNCERMVIIVQRMPTPCICDLLYLIVLSFKEER